MYTHRVGMPCNRRIPSITSSVRVQQAGWFPYLESSLLIVYLECLRRIFAYQTNRPLWFFQAGSFTMLKRNYNKRAINLFCFREPIVHSTLEKQLVPDDIPYIGGKWMVCAMSKKRFLTTKLRDQNPSLDFYSLPYGRYGLPKEVKKYMPTLGDDLHPEPESVYSRLYSKHANSLWKGHTFKIQLDGEQYYAKLVGEQLRLLPTPSRLPVSYYLPAPMDFKHDPVKVVKFEPTPESLDQLREFFEFAKSANPIAYDVYLFTNRLGQYVHYDQEKAAKEESKPQKEQHD